MYTYVRMSIRDPSQKNGLESTNRYLKEDELDNNRLDIIQFLNKLKTDVVRTLSLDRNPKAMVELDGVITESDNRSVKLYNLQLNCVIGPMLSNGHLRIPNF